MRPRGEQGFAAVVIAVSIVLAIAAAAAPAARATDAEIVLSNDLFAGNPFNDDLYTASFALELSLAGRRLAVEERMFTDKRRGVRFDETEILFRLPSQSVGRWNVFSGAGVLHVGRGLFGQDAQNFLHRTIGDREEFLAYPDDRSTFHALAQLAIERPARLPLPGGVLVAPALEIRTAPGFKSHAEAAIKTQWRLAASWTAHVDAGYRVTRSNFAPLDPRTREGGAALRLSIGWRERVHVTWSQNRYGTGARHVAFHVRVP